MRDQTSLRDQPSLRCTSEASNARGAARTCDGSLTRGPVAWNGRVNPILSSFTGTVYISQAHEHTQYALLCNESRVAQANPTKSPTRHATAAALRHTHNASLHHSSMAAVCPCGPCSRYHPSGSARGLSAGDEASELLVVDGRLKTLLAVGVNGEGELRVHARATRDRPLLHSDGIA
jgi:hypothetical protein